MKIHHPDQRPRTTFWVAALATFALIALLAGAWIVKERESRAQEQRLQAAAHAANHARVLQTHLRYSFSSVLALGAYARITPEVGQYFDLFARDLLSLYPEVSSLSLSPDGTIAWIAPKQDNEAAIGFDQLADEIQGAESRLARDSEKLTVSGPLDLVQGGAALVGRYPIFVEDNGGRRFWGFANATMPLASILRAGELEELEALGYQYQLWRIHPVSEEKQIITRNVTGPLKEPVEQTIAIPNGLWTLSLTQHRGWYSDTWLIGAIAFAAVFALVLAYLVKALLELRWHKRHLEREVLERTETANTNVDRYRTLIAASNTGAWEYFHERDYLQCSPEYFSMLGRRRSDYDMSGAPNLKETWTDLIHPDDREQAADVFARYLADGAAGMYENRFRMQHEDGHWVSILSRGQSLWNEEGQLRGVTVGTHIDISREVETEEKLALAAQVFERGSEGFIVTDPDQRILMTNAAFTRITGYSEEEVLGQRPNILSSGRHDARFYQDMWKTLSHKGLWQGEVWNKSKDGQIYPEWLSISQIRNDKGEVSHYIGIISDISQLKEDQKEIHRLAYYDPLTNLPNRSLLEERAAFALNLAQRGGNNAALLFLDLDNFKNINDSLGHKAGDRLLLAFSQRVGAMVREEDTFARPGGDEFILLLPDTDANGAAHAAQKLLDLLIRPFKVDGYDLSVSSSVGIALYPDDGDSLNELYTNADIAMYRSKQKGRNTYSFFTPELQTHYVRLMQLESAMRQALADDQFELHYQPQQELDSGATVGVEALLRWHHPTLGTISPAEFIPIAESSGLIVPIGEWVLREAIAQLCRWIEVGIAPPKMSINLSAAQFRQPNLPDLILSILEETRLPAEYLELELTESMTMDDPERAVTMINRLHAAGVTLSIDDFGTGYSSLSYLKRFKISRLKIDKSFVSDLDKDSDDRVIVSTIVTLAQSLGLRSVAEGVETLEQREFLRTLGCHDIQGYYFSRPLNARDTEAFLRRSE